MLGSLPETFGSMKKFRTAWAAIGSGALLRMLQLSTQNYGPSEGIIYKTLGCFVCTEKKSPFQPSDRIAWPFCIIVMYSVDVIARRCGLSCNSLSFAWFSWVGSTEL